MSWTKDRVIREEGSSSLGYTTFYHLQYYGVLSELNKAADIIGDPTFR